MNLDDYLKQRTSAQAVGDKYDPQKQVIVPCNCIGPQPGLPRCPCMMRNIVKRDGRWIQIEQDLGPAA